MLVREKDGSDWEYLSCSSHLYISWTWLLKETTWTYMWIFIWKKKKKNWRVFVKSIWSSSISCYHQNKKSIKSTLPIFVDHCTFCFLIGINHCTFWADFKYPIIWKILLAYSLYHAHIIAILTWGWVFTLKYIFLICILTAKKIMILKDFECLLYQKYMISIKLGTWDLYL